jgi:hypothetical protein
MAAAFAWATRRASLGSLEIGGFTLAEGSRRPAEPAPFVDGLLNHSVRRRPCRAGQRRASHASRSEALTR